MPFGSSKVVDRRIGHVTASDPDAARSNNHGRRRGHVVIVPDNIPAACHVVPVDVIVALHFIRLSRLALLMDLWRCGSFDARVRLLGTDNFGAG